MLMLIAAKMYPRCALFIKEAIMSPCRIKAALTLGESTMFTVPFRVMNQSLTI